MKNGLVVLYLIVLYLIALYLIVLYLIVLYLIVLYLIILYILIVFKNDISFVTNFLYRMTRWRQVAKKKRLIGCLRKVLVELA